MGYSYVPLKMKAEVFRIRQAAQLTSKILDILIKEIKPGLKTVDIAASCSKLIQKHNADPGLLGFKGFPSVICISVNHVAVHGVPNNYKLKNGDILTLDLTAGLGGWYGDCAKTVGVGVISEEAQSLINAAEKATQAGISSAKAGNRMGDIGAAIEASAAEDGYRVLQNFIGHGIGREIHEEPSVLHCGETNTGRPVVPGMVITIEPVLTKGGSKLATLSDGWSIVTVDKMPCAQFEHTIAVFSDHTEILTE